MEPIVYLWLRIYHAWVENFRDSSGLQMLQLGAVVFRGPVVESVFHRQPNYHAGIVRLAVLVIMLLLRERLP